MPGRQRSQEGIKLQPASPSFENGRNPVRQFMVRGAFLIPRPCGVVTDLSALSGLFNAILESKFF